MPEEARNKVAIKPTVIIGVALAEAGNGPYHLLPYPAVKPERMDKHGVPPNILPPHKHL
jgi:hypothetical protein